MVLSRYDSPFVTGDRQPQFGDLCFAIWVCKRNWAELMDGLRNSSFKREVRFLGLVGRLKNWRKGIIVFVDYMGQALKQPNLFFNKVDGAKPTSMTNLHYMKIVLMSKLFKTKEQAMDTPFGEAVFDIAALGEGEGACGFTTDADILAGEVARRQHERRQQENGKRN
tara:strand:- start:7966 stop:8466 length:501 start_codon:yes stop_codon:yes gene_type:complete